MPGTKAGGKQAVQTILSQNPDHYREAGAAGGRARVAKGFALDRQRASILGAKGGAKSSRLGIKKGEGRTHRPYIPFRHIAPEKRAAHARLRKILDLYLPVPGTKAAWIAANSKEEWIP